ncbi:MAG: discoidin domain-containing protein [Flavobacteriales bacterium]|nr:discoidin domain-containing protein [Flavobacteriales bacterium]
MRNTYNFALKQFSIIVVFVISALSLQAQTVHSIGAEANDVAISNNNSRQWVGYQTHRLGTSKTTCAIIPFKLPNLGAGESVISAEFSSQLIALSGGLDTEIDLYALSYRSSNTILDSDFYAGANDSSNQLVEKGYFTNSSSVGKHISNESAKTALLNFINLQYSNGATGGEYIFIRLAQSTSDASNYNYWDVASQDNGTVSNRPLLTLLSEEVNSNMAPVLNAIGDKSIIAGAISSISLLATDADSDNLSFTATTLPSFASITDNTDGTASIDLNPAVGDEGTYSLTINVSDGSLTDTETISILVTASSVNNEPLLTIIGDQSVEEQSILNVNISASDVDGDILTISASNLPNFATFTDNGDGTAVVALAPQSGDASTYTSTISVSDGIEVVSETISIEITSYQEPVGGVYYCDPVNGNINNDGSQAHPWSSLSAVVYTKKALVAGDVVYLMSGDHGDPYIKDMSFTSHVTVKALGGNAPIIKSIQLVNSAYWAFDGIKIDGTNNSKIKEQVLFSSDVNSHHTKMINSAVSSAESIANWTKSDWYNNVSSGLQIRGDYAYLKNNVIKNTYHALEVRGQHTEVYNNLIDNFAGDAIRGLGSNSTYENNTVRDCYINDYAIQHDDGFQTYNLESDPKVSNVVIRNNVFLLFADPVTQFVQDNSLIGDLMQGIIITDGYADGWIVENNIVSNNQDHGISLYGARNCKVQNNTVVQSPIYSDADHVPWIMLTDQKKTGQNNFNNIIRNNISAKFTTWTYDSTSTVEHNVTIDGSSYSNYSNYFVDYANNDFHLSATSPAIDAGVNTDLAATDLEGNPRSMGASVDAGAYEFTGTVTPPANKVPELASIGSKTLNELETVEIAISATDGDNEALTITVENAPSFSTFVDNGDGTALLSLAPQEGDANSYNITVSVTDGTDSVEEIVLVSVNAEGTPPVNNAPVIADVTNQSVEENGILNVNISATDGDSDTLTLISNNLPSFATFTDNGDGTALFEFRPLEGDAGTYTLNVDALDATDTTTVSYVLSVSGYSDVVGTAYYCDPVNGSMSNSGTEASPWKSLQDVFAAKKTFNSGDVIYLLTGAHGSPFMTGSHSDYVTVKPLNGENPVIASIQVESASYWAFDGLTFSTNGSGGSFARDYMFLTKDNATYLKIENCTFSCAENSSAWSKNDWYTNSEDAVIIRGDNTIFNNNTIKNVYFALQMEGDYVEVRNNLIDNFGADAIRALGSHAIYENNIIRDAYVEDYSVNHDDGIQMYDKDNVAAGIIEDVIIRNNKIFNFADPITQGMVDDNLVGYSMQGIIITDGHTENVFVENNLVVSDHYHGITLTGAINCKIQNNTVSKTPTSYNPTVEASPWIQIKNDKQGNGSTGNIIRNNIATKYTPWTYDEATNTAENNVVATADDATSYYVDYNNFNFNLKAGSPAIDAGVNTGLTATDIEGNLRSVGSAVDCGAFELQANDDTTAPAIAKANNTYYNDEFVIVFSESVTAATAEIAANYSLDGGATVNSAILSADKKTVTITTSVLNGNVDYIITANNVKDFAGNASSNASATFIHKCDTDWASSFQDDQWGYNPSSNAFDGDLNTKWSADGSQWIQKSFCEVTTVKSVDIVFGLGDERAYTFIVEVSTDGREYTQVLSATSTGTTTDPESFDFADVSAKYVRITGSGSNVNGWNNYSEIVINTSGYTPPINVSPVLASIGEQAVLEGEILNVNISASDADGDDLSFTTSNLPSFASFVDNGDGTAVLSLSPQLGDESLSDVTISVSDGDLGDSELVSIVVDAAYTPINKAPVLSAIGNKSMKVDEAMVINIYASDADNEALEFTITDAPSFAVFEDLYDGSSVLTLNPLSEDVGTYSITISVNDGDLSDSETIVLDVSANQAPVENTIVVAASNDDQTVYNNLGTQWVGYHTHRLGTNKLISAVIPFEIPTLVAGESIVSASLNLQLLSKSGALENVIDLYGLPYRSFSVMLTSDFYAGEFNGDVNAVALQQSILDNNSALGSFSSNVGSAMADYINQEIANGAVAGDYVFFRLSINTDNTSNYNYWDIASNDHTSSEYRPSLSLVTETSMSKSLENISEENLEVNVYPNPIVNNSFTMELPKELSGDKSVLRIFSLNGIEVYSRFINNNQKINVSLPIDVSKGVYVIKVNNSSNTIIRKIVLK